MFSTAIGNAFGFVSIAVQTSILEPYLIDEVSGFTHSGPFCMASCYLPKFLLFYVEGLTNACMHANKPREQVLGQLVIQRGQ